MPAAAKKPFLLLALLGVLAIIFTAGPAGASERYRHKQLFGERHLHAPVKDDDCTACHSVHSPESGSSLRQKPPDLCYSCHDRFSGRSRHSPVAGGRCLACHEAHGSGAEGLLKETIPGLCLGCHGEKKSGRHRKATYSGLCSQCHAPHASSAPNLLVPNARGKCSSCHSGKDRGKSVHSAIEEYGCRECHDPHASPPVQTMECTECHDDLIDGANLHPPLEDGCWDCHASHSGPFDKQLLAGLPDLCVECHDDKEYGRHGRITLGTDCIRCHEPHSSDRRKLLTRHAANSPCAACHVSVLSRPVKHTPLLSGRCRDCHNPHREDPVPVKDCRQCHEDKLSGKHVHEPAGEDCANCHATHSGDRGNQLLEAVPDLCYQCHDDKEGGTHGKVQMDVNCLRCHDPHSSPRPGMLKLTIESDGCIDCHQDVTRKPVVHSGVEEYSCDECHNRHADPPEPALDCTECHDDLLSGPVVHEPAEEDCTNCHETHSGVRKSMLLEEQPELCLQCHDDKEGGIHGRTRMSTSCISCHNPHSGKRRGLVEDLAGRRCQSCHQDKAGFRFRHSALGKYQCADCHNPHTDPPEMPPISCHQCHDNLRDESPLHSAEADIQCRDCHDPHGSDNPSSLVDDGALDQSLCLTCHQDVARKLQHGLVKHSPVARGNCRRCHHAHAGEKPYTTMRFENDMYVPYERDAYELCLSCHPYTTVQARFTDTDTNFRNGSVNLHYVHVVRDGDRGFSCWVCHDMHATRQPHLLNRENPYNPSYRLKINYRETDDGGECRTNCHTTREYRR